MELGNNEIIDNLNISDNWKFQVRQLKKSYPLLTDADLYYENGKENELLQKVQARLTKNTEEAIHIINNSHPEKAFI